MKVALLHNVRPAGPSLGLTDAVFEEYDSPETIASIAAALRALGVAVQPVLADRRLPWSLEDARPDFAFNIAEGEGRRCREAIPAAVCDVTVAVVGNGQEARVLGMMEIGPAVAEEDRHRAFVYSLPIKREWRHRVCYHVPPRLTAAVQKTIAGFALTAYRLLGCRDIARVDFRLAATGEPHFMECNPLPGLDPANSDIVILSRGVISYDGLVQGILLDAARRCGVRVS